jgi:hypothetical protein
MNVKPSNGHESHSRTLQSNGHNQHDDDDSVCRKLFRPQTNGLLAALATKNAADEP